MVLHQKNTLILQLSDNITNLIMSCITMSRVAVLINGDKTNFFKPSRGIKQGDPLSPYIFILYMVMLSCKIEKAVQQKIGNPIKISKKGSHLSHLFFVDGLVLIARADSNSCSNLKRIIEELCESSGQTINYSK